MVLYEDTVDNLTTKQTEKKQSKNEFAIASIFYEHLACFLCIDFAF